MPDTTITFTILSYGFYLHKAKLLLRRLSRTGLLMGTCTEDSTSQFRNFPKKIIEIPIFSNQTLVIKSSEYDKYYKVIENFNHFATEH
jgi:hypothetical protein